MFCTNPDLYQDTEPLSMDLSVLTDNQGDKVS